MFHSKVLIFDKNNQRKAEWPTARLEVWLDIVRGEYITEESVFESVDIEWEIHNDDENMPNESLNSSKISLNLSLAKDFLNRGGNVLTPNNTPASQKKTNNLNKSVLINSLQKSRNTNRLLTYDDECDENEYRAEEFEELARKYISAMQKNTSKMRTLCVQFQSSNTNSNVEKIKKSIEEIEGQIGYMKNALISSNTSPTKTPKLVRFFLD